MKIITKSLTNSYSFDHLSALGCFFFTIPLERSCKRPVVNSFYFFSKMISNERAIRRSNVCSLEPYFSLVHVSVCMICMFVLCLYVCVRGPLLINVTSYCNGAC